MRTCIAELSLTLTVIDTALEQIQIETENVLVLLGTNNLLVNCSIKINNSIGPLFNALQVSWLMNGTEQLSNTILTPRDNIEHTNSFTSTLTVDITGYDKTGNYCCIASLAGRDGDMSDCLSVTVSGTFVHCCMIVAYHVILVELPTWRLEYSPDIDISKTSTHGKQRSYNNGQKYLTQ